MYSILCKYIHLDFLSFYKYFHSMNENNETTNTTEEQDEYVIRFFFLFLSNYY